MQKNMPVGSLPAQQARSAKTTHRITNALEALLKEKHFEHITMVELAQKAGLTPGAIYRRFKNKQALLPHIFQRHQQMFADWLERVTVQHLVEHSEDLKGALEMLVMETGNCFQENRHIFRTVHLYGRLHPENIRQGEGVNPQADFAPIFGLLKQYEVHPTMGLDAACQFIGYTLVSTCGERALYPEQLPARHLGLNDSEFARHMAEMFLAWLQYQQA